MLEVRENETSLRKWSGGTAQLRTLEEHWFGYYCRVKIRTPTAKVTNGRALCYSTKREV